MCSLVGLNFVCARVYRLIREHETMRERAERATIYVYGELIDRRRSYIYEKLIRGIPYRCFLMCK